MTYVNHKFNLTNNQINKIGRSLHNGISISMKIKKDQYHGKHPLPLTLTELNKIKDGEPEIILHLSQKKLNHIKNNHDGGFLPLLSLIPLVLGGLGAAGGIAGGIATAVSGAKTNSNESSRNEEEKRHNIIMEEEAKRISGSGMGTTKEMIHSKNTVGVTSCPSCGSGLVLKARRGKGLYLRPYNGTGYGDGLITGIANAVGNPATGGQPLPQLPESIADIPIIGSIAKLLW